VSNIDHRSNYLSELLGRLDEALVRDQQILAEAADQFAWTEWKQIVAYWLNAADPHGTLTDPSDPTHTDLRQGMFRPPRPKLR